MSDAPAVSIIIPLYNKKPYIARALNSVLSQSFRDFEVIIVDDGSTDGGAEIVKDFGDLRIRLIQQENKGVSAARNKGIDAAKAKLVAFLDADDEWLPRHLETLLRLWNKYPEAGAFGTSYLIKKKNLGTLIVPTFKEIPSEPWEGLLSSYFKTAALGDPPISASTVAIPKCILMEMKGFSEKAWWGEDSDLWGRIAIKYPIAFSWDGMAIYYNDVSDNACGRREPIEENIFISTAIKALNEGKIPSTLQDDLREYIALKQIETAWFCIRAKRPDLARTVLSKCITSKLVRKKCWAFLWAYMPTSAYELSCVLKQLINNMIYNKYTD